jgi:3-deoxy-D-arabino-heptulosonate 7-phosphate (DAHP) synthase class II
LKLFQADSEIKLASLLDPHNSQGSIKARQKSGSSQLKKRAPSALSKGSKGGKKKTMNDGDFEQMFGKDIDQFLEDSEWDI